jgi:aryl-alcohol dehydrogenase-like predicted oxidoreductase
MLYQDLASYEMANMFTKNGAPIPSLGFGLMGLSHTVYGAIPDDEERFALLDRAYELGATFWDSSE